VSVREREISGYEGEARLVLVVDDNPDNRMVLADLLRTVGFEADTAVDGRDAWDRIGLKRPDLVLTDLVMPGINGFELCRIIHETPQTRDMPVVAVSASLMRSEENKERLKPFAAFISKPVIAGELFREIGRLLGLTWRYAEETPEKAAGVEFAPGKQPDPDTLTELLDLADLGDMLEVQRRLAQLIRQYPKWEEYFCRLETMANDFQADAIAQTIRKTLGDDTAAEPRQETT
jgi:CheY-like chemotaxis protein